eukprot:gb/GECG01014422.1/.p1 GENE.gb/GECG01014422.1/~~gb/GECG01014422.1/.p1  ORF type:complete len:197 (+),score=31.65 gb/GECG01014422.1/:1-591(+)
MHLPGRAYSSVRTLETPLSPIKESKNTAACATASMCSHTLRKNAPNSTQLQRDHKGYFQIAEDNSYWDTVKTSSTEKLKLIRISHLCRGMMQSRYLARQNEEPEIELNHRFFTQGRWKTLGLSGHKTGNTKDNRPALHKEKYSIIRLFENADEACVKEASNGFRKIDDHTDDGVRSPSTEQQNAADEQSGEASKTK